MASAKDLLGFFKQKAELDNISMDEHFAYNNNVATYSFLGGQAFIHITDLEAVGYDDVRKLANAKYDLLKKSLECRT